MTEEAVTYTPNGPAPFVTPDGSQLTARRPGRELFPSSWLRHNAEITHSGGASTKGFLLEFCGVGLVQTREGKALVSWDVLEVVELTES